MIVIGADVHKKSHTLVALDQRCQKVGQGTFIARRDGHAKAVHWVRAQFPDQQVRWAIEDCRSLSAGLERDLLAAGAEVVRVPPKLMGIARRGQRASGKSDPIDAEAVARAAWADPDLPAARLDPTSRRIRLLNDRRNAVVKTRTAAINRLREHLHELDPDLDPAPGALDRAITHRRVHAAVQPYTASPDPVIALLADLALDLLADIIAATARIKELEATLAPLVKEAAPQLLELPGCGVLTAATIIGHTAGIDRFRDEAAYAMFAGAAPIPVWSGNTHGRVRLNRGGDRQVLTAFHRIAITQVRFDGPAKAFIENQRARGKTKKEAYRSLRRYLARTVYNLLKQPQRTTLATAA